MKAGTGANWSIDSAGWHMGSDLGIYSHTPPHPAGSLNLHDLGELIRRRGMRAGFVVQSECPPASKNSHQRADWCWFMPGATSATVAFEIEGRDVVESLIKDGECFREHNPAIAVVALFSVDHDHKPKAKRRRDDEEMLKLLDPERQIRDLRILTDVKLWSEGALDIIARDARAK